MRKSIFPDFGIPTYPSPTARHGERIGITPLRRCMQCGEANDTRKTGSGRMGDGLSQIANSNPADFVATTGCHFCGSLQWIKGGKVRKLPDDRFLPTPGIKKKRR